MGESPLQLETSPSLIDSVDTELQSDDNPSLFDDLDSNSPLEVNSPDKPFEVHINYDHDYVLETVLSFSRPRGMGDALSHLSSPHISKGSISKPCSPTYKSSVHFRFSFASSKDCGGIIFE